MSPAGDAESGRMIADQAGHHIVADEVDFGRAFRLRIGEDEHIEFLRLVGFLQCEVHRVRQRAGGFDAAIAQLQALRRARGLVNVVEARQHLLVDRHRIAGGLDHEDDAFFIDRQRVAPGGIGLDDVAAVGNQDAGDTRIARRAPRAAGADLINEARNRVGGGRRHDRSGRYRDGRGCAVFHDVAARGLRIAAAEAFIERFHGRISASGRRLRATLLRNSRSG